METDKVRFSDIKVMELSEEFHQYCKVNDSRAEVLERKLAETSVKLDKLVQNTADIIQLHSDIVGTARLGIKVQRVGFWLVKWPLIGTGLYTAYEWIIHQLPR